ncbi:VOC family protein [Catellatospora bangladeshensis]|uniref:VOC domain-containing protein n=1 Tax=Catellatospora bangladeshensis TaxID=310355 RepID=A0A8J3JIG8_9ACTN|nr:VOC family protein [Catellatospora bangladeshensis]GIF81263.1 hypothetical protein Cba03nite_26120 [Catellatospora bangladeshensis]
MVRIGAIVWQVSDLGRAREFWRGALGYEATPDNPDFLADPRGTGPRLHLDTGDRMHLDLWAEDAAEQRAEVARLVSLGARVVEDWTYPEDADFVVLADPDGNLFCVIDKSA